MGLAEFAWFLAVIATGTATGAMVGHALLLGRFFSWALESDTPDILSRGYAAFLRAKRPQLLFDNLMTAALLITAAYNVLLAVVGELSVLPVAAAALQWLFVAVFFGTGFAKLEGAILQQGDTAPDRVTQFLSRNTPNLILFAVLWLASFASLVLMSIAR